MGFSSESAKKALEKRYAAANALHAKRSAAAKAREASRTRLSSAPEELESVVEQVQDAPEKAEAAGAPPEVVQMKRESLEQLMRNIETLTKQVNRLEEKKVIDTPEHGSALKCSSCGQSMRVCKGEHTAVMVAPRDMDLWKSFSGINWNGVKYAGRCLIPTCCVQDILAQIGQWEMQERRRFIPGGKVFGDMDMKHAMQGRTAII